MADDPAMGGFTVEITTDKGVKGYGRGGPAGGAIVEKHLTKLLMNEDPFDIERLWDTMWRSTMYYGRAGAVVQCHQRRRPRALGPGRQRPRSYRCTNCSAAKRSRAFPTYCTGNDLEQHVEYGFKRLKLAIPHGPADGKEGMRKNVELVKRTRELLGPDGDIMLDCWMAWTERYTIEIAEMFEPYKVYWMEECLQPHDYEGFGRLNAGDQVDAHRHRRA